MTYTILKREHNAQKDEDFTMDDITKKKLAAAGKIAFGLGRMVSGVATATGHGIVGSYLKNHHMRMQAMRLGKEGFEAGQKCLNTGLEEWKRLR